MAGAPRGPACPRRSRPGHRDHRRGPGGDFEPARGPSFTSVRIVRELYAPRITLRFTLTDGTGTVVREGERTLGDPMFLTRATLDQHGPLRHETALLETWLDREFAGAR
jgi:Protein of unknown function (DUF3016)